VVDVRLNGLTKSLISPPVLRALKTVSVPVNLNLRSALLSPSSVLLSWSVFVQIGIPPSKVAVTCSALSTTTDEA
jgi:hypothetical protein